jgi:hypothetical protein
MQIYLPPDRRLEATPATPPTAAPVATTAVVDGRSGGSATRGRCGAGGSVKAHPGAGRPSSPGYWQSSGPGVSKNQLKFIL